MRKLRYYSEALEKLDPNDPNSLLIRIAKAKALMSIQKLERAKEDLRIVLKNKWVGGETEASAWHAMGLIKLREHDAKKAKEAFTKAIKARHTNDEMTAESFANRALTSIQLNEPDRALSDIGQAVQLRPDYPFAFAVAAQARLKQGNLDQAKKNAEKALSMKPDPNTRRIAGIVLREAEAGSSWEKSKCQEELTNNATVLSKSKQRLILKICSDGHIFVNVKFGKRGSPSRFMLDTGATYTLISRALLNRIKETTEVREVGKETARLADGSIHPMISYQVKGAYLYDMPLGAIQVHVMANETAAPMSLLGVKSLGNVRITIDPEQNEAEISLVTR